MRITTNHRAHTERCEPEAYRAAAVAAAQVLQGRVADVVLCGSTVKDDIVPGWSDLDIVVVTRGEYVTSEELERTRAAIEAAHRVARIGIGIDLAGQRGLRAEGRIGGRPLAMTYEVGRYGEALVGENRLLALAPSVAALRARIGIDAWPHILAELHNWHRYYCDASAGMDSATLYATSIKTWLKVLKHLVEPDTVPPFTHVSYLSVFAERNKDLGELANLLSTAVEARAAFGATDFSDARFRDAFAVLNTGFTSSKVLEQIEVAHARRT
jgi:predicted nucleotidyltransferase